ncbi:MAG TPA: hypothetical protein VHZ51_22505 [Ktedonobacteraceae bacterium]|jgi:hypothetical protein|nr:hypothetical protein [Ktedonobacteraceae bacterium]
MSSSSHTLTFGDVCRAIAEGQIPSAIEGSVYQINAFELRRYLNALSPLPSISTEPFPESLYGSSSSWSPSAPNTFS